MKIGICALTSNLEDALELCHSNTIINHIEIGIDNINNCEKLREYLDEIKNLGLSVGIHLPLELNTAEDINVIRDSWVDFVKTVHNKLDFIPIDYYNLHLGHVMTNRLNRNRREYLDNTVDFLDKLRDIDNFKITIENNYTKGGDFSNIGTNVEDFKYIFQNTKNRNLHFCYDTGHDLINNSDYFQIGDKFKVVHLSDNNGKIDQHLGIKDGNLSEYMIRKALSSNSEYLVLEMGLGYVKKSSNHLKENYL